MTGDEDAVFRFGWRGSHYSGQPVEDLRIAIGRDSGGAWWFDAYFIGRVRLRGGAPHAAGFARWLLTVPPEGPYESEFLLIDDEPRPGPGISWIPPGETVPVRIKDTRLNVEFLLGREEHGGPEYLQVIPVGHAPEQGIGFQICAELECEPMDRIVLERAAATLLTTASG